MAVALTALVVASSGTSYAAVKFSGQDLRRGSVPADRLKANSLTGTQINESKLATVPSAASAQTAQTAQAAQTAGLAANADRIQGLPASAFMAGTSRVATDRTVDLATGSGISLKVFCEPSERAISGGGGWYVPGTDVHTSLETPVTASTPIVSGGEVTGWEVSGRNLSGSDRFLRTYAICVPKTP